MIATGDDATEDRKMMVKDDVDRGCLITVVNKEKWIWQVVEREAVESRNKLNECRSKSRDSGK